MDTTNLFPQEYQAELDAQKRKLMQAQILQRYAESFNTDGSMVSGHYVAPSIFTRLAKLTAQSLGNYNTDQAMKNQSETTQRYQTDALKDITDVIAKAQPHQGMAPDMSGVGQTGGMDTNEPGRTMQELPGNLNQAISSAQSSPFPATRKLAEMLEARRKDVFDKMAPVSTPGSIASSGGDASQLRPVTTSVKSYPVEGGFGATTVVGTERGPTNVVANVKDPPTPAGAKWGFKVQEDNFKNLSEKVLPEMQKNLQTLTAVARAKEIVNTPDFKTGFGADFKTNAQKFGALFNFQVPENVASQQELSNVLLPQLTQTLRAVAPVGSTTERELKVAMDRAITSNFDPRAISALIDRVEKANKGEIQHYNGRVMAGAAWAERAQKDDPTVDPQIFRDLYLPLPGEKAPYSSTGAGGRGPLIGDPNGGARQETIKAMQDAYAVAKEDAAKGSTLGRQEMARIARELLDFGVDVNENAPSAAAPSTEKRMQWRPARRTP